MGSVEKKYPLAERFVAPQGEGLKTGQMTAFLRFVGCSVGQKVCTACDTDFDRIHKELGGGTYTAAELDEFTKPIPNVCLTGGEPLDRDLSDLVWTLTRTRMKVQIETSGTVYPDWVRSQMIRPLIHLTISPKPGYIEELLARADEIKVILHGLGDGPGWPTVQDALRWSKSGKSVFLQPRNFRNDIDMENLAKVLTIVNEHPTLRVSAQLHKFIRTR